MAKYQISKHCYYITDEAFYDVERHQSKECKEEMINSLKMYIPTVKFSDRSQQLLAEDIFKKAWMLSRLVEIEK